MKQKVLALVGASMLGAVMLLPEMADAALEVNAPDGRRVLLKDDGTWQYVDDKAKSADGKPAGKIELTLERKTERGKHCTYEVRFTNNLAEEVGNLVLYYSVYRANGVMYDSVSSESGLLKPGNTRNREIDFDGIACSEIARLQVGGGDRCEIGELHKWSDKKGECLALVNVVASDLVRFDK